MSRGNCAFSLNVIPISLMPNALPAWEAGYVRKRNERRSVSDAEEA
jgi:hypothetical protein